MQSWGEIRGFPSAAGEAHLTFQVTDSASQVASRTLILRILSPMQLVTQSVAAATTGVPYDFQFELSGGLRPTFNFSLGSGWPCCIRFSGSRLQGIPQEVGSYPFSVSVRDESGQFISRNFTLQVQAGPLYSTTTSLPAGSVGTPYLGFLNAEGGARPFSWRLAGGSLPPGITLDGAALTGTPATAGSYQATFEVSDSGSPAQRQTVTLSIDVQ